MIAPVLKNSIQFHHIQYVCSLMCSETMFIMWCIDLSFPDLSFYVCCLLNICSITFIIQSLIFISVIHTAEELDTKILKSFQYSKVRIYSDDFVCLSPTALGASNRTNPSRWKISLLKIFQTTKDLLSSGT